MRTNRVLWHTHRNSLEDMATTASLSRSAPGHRRRLVESLRRERVLSDPDWIAAFTAVPRHVFLRRFFTPEEAGWRAITESDPGWLDQIYSDEVLVTQLDGNTNRWETARKQDPVTGLPTSSSSMPSIMAIMLEELLVLDGHNVLEIGTGTGYNAALLCHRLGPRRVSTVDVDEQLVRSAQTALAKCGYHPRCAVADGAEGFAERAPFDRVLLTCSLSRFPPALLEQTRPGGYVVSTLNRPIGAGLVRLTVHGPDRGSGRVLPGDGRFMPLRAHRLATAEELLARRSASETSTATGIPISAVLNTTSPFEFFAGFALPGVVPVSDPDSPGTYLLHSDGSWALHYPADGGYAVLQGGPRRLWDRVEREYSLWRALGKPTRERFGVSVTPGAQEFWLDSPESERRWPLE